MWVFAAVVAGLGGWAQAGKVCDLSFTECPAKMSNGIMKVPPELIWLDAKVPYCNEYVRIVNGSAKPPSIVFIIDNSASMDENDPEVARFDVVSTLLDNIYNLVPAAEVGLVVFTRRLSFDHRENPFFKTAFPGDTSQHDSYVPLTALNKTFANGRTGIDTLKALLSHNSQGDLTYVTQLPASRNNSGIGRRNTRDGTDITLGFMAAKLAMQDAKSDKNSQFFVFLSDGGASSADNGREDMLYDYIKGTGVPTTFTIFFDTQNSTPVPNPTLFQMTNNIKINGYSNTNAKSNLWAISLPKTELFDLLQNNVVGNVLSVPAKPKEARIMTRDSTFRSSTMDKVGFHFPRHLNLLADTTRLELDYTYTYVDTSGGATSPKEKTVPYALTIVRSAPATPIPQGAGESCREQAQIGLYKDGQPVNAVTVDDASLEARLIMPDSSACKGCRLQVMPSSGKVKDLENVPLTAAGGYLTGSFQQEENPTALLGDGRLQHLPKDSIVVLYVSPENPLDAVRRAYPYRGAPTILNLAHDTGYVRCPYVPASALPQFVVVAPAGFQAAPREIVDRWRTLDAVPPSETGRYAGVTVEASRAFVVDMRIYTNLGGFVNKLEFTVSQDNFEKLAKTAEGHSRSMKILWDSRALTGAVVATGAYVVKTSVTLLPIPGMEDEKELRVDYRRVGVLRSL